MYRFLVFLLLVGSAFAQRTTVTALVKDTNNTPYVNCSFNVDFVGQNTTPGAPPYTLGGSTFQTSYPGAKCDSFGNLQIQLPDNNIISPAPSQWNFQVCSAKGYQPGDQFCFTALVTITGATQDITADLQAAAAILPVPVLPITLQTNGVNNGSQTLLNLIAGTNITLTNVGGNTTIDSTAAGVTFPLLAPDGALGTPPYAYAAATGTGWYRHTASGDLAVSMNGAIAPILSFNLSGLYLSQAKFICFTAGDSTGHVCNGELTVVPGGGGDTTYNWFDQSVAQTQANFNLGRVDTNASTYALSGFESSTPTAPSVSHQKGYFKAGKGFCAEDSASVEYCTVNTAASGNPAIVAKGTSTTLLNTTVGNSNTNVMSVALTMPSSGCPCRAQATWFLYLSATASGQDVAYVQDNQSPTYAAGAETATPGSASGYGLQGAGYFDTTYTNNQNVTFTLVMAGSHAGSTTVHTTQQGTSITGGPGSSLQILIFPSN